ncbi:hypothetical protein HYT33_03975 [Candidatus Roizmanbacteria bacterium]|nr:hypothetical protein [Candidatus Roizmanbacteria bacterium]
MIKRRDWKKIFNYVLLIVLFGLNAAVLFYVPPFHPAVVVLFILSFSFLLSTTLSMFTSNKKTRYLAFALSFLFLLTNAFVGFNVLNIILLVSFIIGVRLLLK